MKTRRILTILLCLLVLAMIISVVLRADTLPAPENTASLGRSLGLLSLVPPLFAVLTAFLTGNVILSLLGGVLVGAAMLTATGGGGMLYGTFHRAVVDIVDTLSERDNAQVIILCVAIGGMEGVIRRSGGFETAARKLAARLNSPRKVNLAGQIFCTLFFFDDYANALISGPVLTPVTDKAGVSREKLSCIVDTTAAPLAGIAVISSWVAVEVSVIQDGLNAAGSDASAFHIFFSSIPYCFYCLFALAFILLLAFIGREYGPMLAAEQRAREGLPLKEGTRIVTDRREDLPDPHAADHSLRRILLAFGSVLLLLVFTLIAFYVTGRNEAVLQGLISADTGFRFRDLTIIIGCADTIQLVMEAALLAGAAALLAGTVLDLFSLGDGILAWLDGAAALLPTIVILILAWALAGTVEELGAVYFVVDAIQAGIPKFFVPTLIFLTCCVISFAAGSYGCMFMVMPMAIPIVAAMGGIGENPTTDPFLLSCVAGVLSGSIFGDHCSPMTDCTILAALGAGCETMDHVRTQMPYALTVAAASVLCGTLLTSFGVSVWLSLAIGVVALGLVIRFAGKKP